MSAKYACLVGALLLSMLPSAGGGQQIPDPIVYRFFFAHLENLDKVAAQQEARGKDGNAWRSHEQRAAGLSAAEGAVLKQVATDCNLAVKQQRARMRAAFAAQMQAAQGKSLRGPSPELRQLAQEGDEMVGQRIERLRAELGEAAFRKLDDYLQRSFKPKIKAQPVSTARARRGAR
jgi:hypothetical protein